MSRQRLSPRRMPVLLALVLLVGAAVSVAVARPRAAGLAQPHIINRPADPTAQRSATFTFRDARAGVRFACSLDGVPFVACTSPTTYAGPLAEARHTFRVRATLGARRSTADSWAWRIDLTPPPAPAIADGPASLSNSTSARFRFSDAQRGVSFLCKLDAAAWARCGSPRNYTRLGQGPHTFQTKARDDAGNTSAARLFSWVVDTVAPPTPLITSDPGDPTESMVAVFFFTDSEPGVFFDCRLHNPGDGGWNACSTPFTGTAQIGQNGFEVRARDGAGNTSDAGRFSWTVQSPQQQGVPFSIAGDAKGLLYPGRSVPIDLVLTNPNPVPITVTSVTVTIGGTSSSDCPVPGNFSIAGQLGTSVVVPASSTSSLSALGVPQASWPHLAMDSPPANQDGCKNATIDLTYSGSAHS